MSDLPHTAQVTLTDGSLVKTLQVESTPSDTIKAGIITLGISKNGEPVVIAPYVEERYVSEQYIRDWVAPDHQQRIIDTYLNPESELYVGKAYVLAKGDPKPGETPFQCADTEHAEESSVDLAAVKLLQETGISMEDLSALMDGNVYGDVSVAARLFCNPILYPSMRGAPTALAMDIAILRNIEDLEGMLKTPDPRSIDQIVSEGVIEGKPLPSLEEMLDFMKDPARMLAAFALKDISVTVDQVLAIPDEIVTQKQFQEYSDGKGRADTKLPLEALKIWLDVEFGVDDYQGVKLDSKQRKLCWCKEGAELISLEDYKNNIKAYSALAKDLAELGYTPENNHLMKLVSGYVLTMEGIGGTILEPAVSFKFAEDGTVSEVSQVNEMSQMGQARLVDLAVGFALQLVRDGAKADSTLPSYIAGSNVPVAAQDKASAIIAKKVLNPQPRPEYVAISSSALIAPFESERLNAEQAGKW